MREKTKKKKVPLQICSPLQGRATKRYVREKTKKTLSDNNVIEGGETVRKERQTKSEINGKRRD